MDAWEEADLNYQVTVIAERTDQAEWLADRVRRALLERTAPGGWVNGLTVPRVGVWARRLLVDEGFDRESSKGGVVSGSLSFQFAVAG
ncbi:hypothetical protein ACIBCO_40640 [Streptomyces violascens]|uniref:hypothetical protein n=1 Tax=Streptomyces violascens TaxID=67381 RepID=UPI00379DEB58